MLAAELGVPAKVDFLKPAPLGIALTMNNDPAGKTRLFDGDVVLAVGRPHETSDSYSTPAPPLWEEAVRASTSYLAMTDNEYPDCFGCGPAVSHGEGMRVFTGPIRERDLVAAAWVPSDAFAGADGTLLPTYVWSALDCPGGSGQEAVPLERARGNGLSDRQTDCSSPVGETPRRYWMAHSPGGPEIIRGHGDL